jgi:signal transduction histidine kinase/ActR/RegA family two-component response regulator
LSLVGLAFLAILTLPHPAQHTTSIREAVQLTPRNYATEETNRSVTVTGVVTVPSARTDSSLGVFIQERNSGIRLFEHDYRGPSLFAGDSIEATGKLGIYYGQEEIVSPIIRILRRRLRLHPVQVSAEQVSDGSFHGLLVRCEGKVVGSAFRSNGVLLYFTDSNDDTAAAFLDFRQDPLFDPGTINPGDSYLITGVSTRFAFKKPFKDNNDLLLRSAADLKPIPKSFISRYSGPAGLIFAAILVLIGSLAIFTYLFRAKMKQKTAQLEDQAKILRVFFDSIAELTGVLDRREILTLALRRAHSLAGTGAVVFGEIRPSGGGLLLTSFALSGERLSMEAQKFENNPLAPIFEGLSEKGSIWNTNVEKLMLEASGGDNLEALLKFLSTRLPGGNITVVAPNPTSKDFLVAFNHVGPISRRLPRALIVSYILHVYSAYRSAELFDVVKEQGEALERLYNNSVFGLMTISGGGVIQTANKIATQMFVEDGLAGKKVRDYLAREDASRFDDLLASVNAVSKEKFVRFAAEVETTRGRRNFEFALQYEPASQIFYVTVQDTSDREYYENYATKEKKIETLEKLASSLTHDLNNIVGSITGYASLLKRKLPQESKEHHYADIIEDSSRRTTELVKEVLGFAQLDAKSMDVVDLNRFSSDIVADFRKTHGDKYSILLTPFSRPIHTRISTSQMKQVMLAVLTNAADAMENGGTIICSVGLADMPESAPAYVNTGEHCFVEIEDHGPGMDDTIKRRIFEPFFTTKRVKKYTGLSLSMAYNIVKHHKGFIEVESAPGTGTRVKIFLPCFSEKAKLKPEPETSRTVKAKGAKVLVVDDEEGVRQLGHDILSEHGYEVITANNGLQALERIKDNPDIRLVVLDMLMPGMGGKDTCLEIKKRPEAPKVLICTGYSELSDLESILGKYADGLLQKPYSTSEMTTVVDNLLSTSPS